MADRYLLESGSPDGYLLEDGSGVLLLETGVFWDPITGFNKHNVVALSNGNLTASSNSGGVYFASVRANLPTAVNAFQYEVALSTTSTPGNIAVGIDNGLANLNVDGTKPGETDSNGVCLQISGSNWFISRNGGNTQGPIASPAPATSQVVTIVGNKSTGTLAFYVNGTQIGVTETGIAFTDWYAYNSTKGTGVDASTSTANFSGPFTFGSASAYDGTVSGTALTGQSLTSTIGSLLAATALALTGQALTVAQGSVGVQRAPPFSGQSLSAAQGSATSSVTVALTGQSLSVGQGSVGIGAALSGKSLSVAQGSIAEATSVALTGQSLSVARGTTAPATAEALSGQTTTVAQGTLTPGTAEALSGQSLSVARGSLTGAPSIALSGQGAVVANGTVGSSNALALTGGSIIVSQGTVTAVTGASAALTGQSLSIAQGSLAPAASTALSGQPLSVASGSLIAAYALPLSGQGLTAAAGSLLAASSRALTGQSLVVALGNLTVVSSDVTSLLSGQGMSLGLGNLIATVVNGSPQLQDVHVNAENIVNEPLPAEGSLNLITEPSGQIVNHPPYPPAELA